MYRLLTDDCDVMSEEILDLKSFKNVLGVYFNPV